MWMPAHFTSYPTTWLAFIFHFSTLKVCHSLTLFSYTNGNLMSSLFWNFRDRITERSADWQELITSFCFIYINSFICYDPFLSLWFHVYFIKIHFKGDVSSFKNIKMNGTPPIQHFKVFLNLTKTSVCPPVCQAADKAGDMVAWLLVMFTQYTSFRGNSLNL